MARLLTLIAYTPITHTGFTFQNPRLLMGTPHPQVSPCVLIAMSSLESVMVQLDSR